MKRKVSMQADELTIGMLVHHPSWTGAPDRVSAIEDIIGRVSSRRLSIYVEGTAKPFTVYDEDYVEVTMP